jgi:hypothetical protein
MNDRRRVALVVELREPLEREGRGWGCLIVKKSDSRCWGGAAGATHGGGGGGG